MRSFTFIQVAALGLLAASPLSFGLPTPSQDLVERDDVSP
jgi:hypothetical protein